MALFLPLQLRADTPSRAVSAFDPLGYVTESINNYDGSILFTSPAALCATVPSIVYRKAGKACTSQAGGASFCYPADLACPDDRLGSVETSAFNDTAMYASESCAHTPRTVYIAGALGQIRYISETKKCTCVDFGGDLNPVPDVWANPDNCFCYAPPQMFAAADRLT